jgi:hypothetical protein
MTGGNGRLRLGFGGVVAGALALAALAPAGAGAAGGVSCRSTALRLGSLQVSTANLAGAPCRADIGNSPIRSGYDTIEALGSQTAGGARSGSSSANLLRLEDDGLVGPAALRLLSSSAYVHCVGGHAVIEGGSEIIATEATSLATTPQILRNSLNLGPIHLNQATTSGHTATYRALHIDGAGGGVTVGESQAGYSGNPC